MRDFFFLKENNSSPLIKASTGWLLLNAETKRPTRPKSLPDTVVFLPKIKALDEDPKKLEKLSEPKFLKSFTIEYTDIDMNNHVNNTKYIEFILNSFPIKKFESQRINALTLFFFSEAKYGEKVDILSKEDTNISQLLIRNKTKDSEILRADISWKEL